MIKKSITINKTYLTLLHKNNNINIGTSSIIRPGVVANSILRPSLNLKTDKGQQKVALYQYKNFLNKPKNITMDRLDISLTLIHFTTSIKESKLFIRNKNIKVNGKIITNINYVLPEYAVIECVNNTNIKNLITHSIKNFINVPTNFIFVNPTTVIKTRDITKNIKEISIPKNIQLNILKRGKVLI